MKKRVIIIRCIGFGLSFLLVFLGFQFVLQPNWKNENHLSYIRARLFYQENPSPDVVFIGASHIYRGINPLILFQEQGIASYDFGSGTGGIDGYRLYTEEAIRTHGPQLIVIDAHNIYRPMNSEVVTRRWFDPIPLSYPKMSAVSSMMKNNEQYGYELEYDSWLSYMFPLLRYHDRWSELTETDFKFDQKLSNYSGVSHYHGSAPTYRSPKTVNFDKYDNSVKFNDSVLEEAKQYFEEIVNLCKESGTELLIINMPAPSWREDYHDLIASWCAEYDVTFADYNDVIDEIGIDVSTDFYDDNHLTDTGATKVTYYVGQYLKNRYDLPDHRDDSAYADWDYDWQIYQQDKAAYWLSREKDWTSYLEKLKDSNYTVYLAACDNLGGDKHPELTGVMKTLGLTSKLNTATRTGYLAIIDRGELIFERLKDSQLTYQTKLNGHTVELASESGNYDKLASIKLDGIEYSVNHRGINIVVYDNLLEDVVDCVAFDLRDDGKAYR